MAETAKTMPEKKKEQTLPFYKLFSFADKYDYILMISGSIGAIIHGSSMPFFFLLFGQMVNGFGKNQSDLSTMTHEVSKYALYFVYLGLVVCVSSYAEIGCWMYTGERQVSALRKRYLEAVLKQDVGFYDTDARTGDIVFGISTDTLLVQDAISEKVGNFIHYLSTFLAGLVVGFVSAWKLALLSIAVIPGIAFAGGLYAYTLTGLTSKSRESYANAGIIAEELLMRCRWFDGGDWYKNKGADEGSWRINEAGRWGRLMNLFDDSDEENKQMTGAINEADDSDEEIGSWAINGEADGSRLMLRRGLMMMSDVEERIDDGRRERSWDIWARDGSRG